MSITFLRKEKEKIPKIEVVGIRVDNSKEVKYTTKRNDAFYSMPLTSARGGN